MLAGEGVPREYGARTLLALAREGHGLAIVPTTALIDARRLRLAPLVFRGSQLSVPIGVLWNSQHRQPRYADEVNVTLAEHMQSVMTKFEQQRERAQHVPLSTDGRI